MTIRNSYLLRSYKIQQKTYTVYLTNPISLKNRFHIFEKQVYGLAPTEIIYRIAINFILGFADETDTFKHNFRQADTLPAAKEGTLQALLNELYS